MPKLLPKIEGQIMATSAQIPKVGPSTVRARRRFRWFFPGMALFAIAIASFAFVPEYVKYGAGTFPIAWVLHIHGAIMAAWLGVFLAQAWLGATGRIAQHRKIGSFGFAIGWLAWVSMIFVEWRNLRLMAPPDNASEYDWLLPGPYVYLIFPLFLAWSYRERQRPDWHKRFIVIALFLSLLAAIERFLWIPVRYGFWPFAAVLDLCLLVPLFAYDLKALKLKLHPATVRGAAIIVVSQGILLGLWGSKVWRHFAETVAQAVRP